MNEESSQSLYFIFNIVLRFGNRYERKRCFPYFRHSFPRDQILSIMHSLCEKKKTASTDCLSVTSDGDVFMGIYFLSLIHFAFLSI